MAKTTVTEVRKDETDGRLYVWGVTTSDIPGEGGQERRGTVDRPSATEQILRVERDVASLSETLASKKKELEFWEDVKAQVVALEAAAEK